MNFSESWHHVDIFVERIVLEMTNPGDYGLNFVLYVNTFEHFVFDFYVKIRLSLTVLGICAFKMNKARPQLGFLPCT